MTTLGSVEVFGADMIVICVKSSNRIQRLHLTSVVCRMCISVYVVYVVISNSYRCDRIVVGA